MSTKYYGSASLPEVSFLCDKFAAKALDYFGFSRDEVSNRRFWGEEIRSINQGGFGMSLNVVPYR